MWLAFLLFFFSKEFLLFNAELVFITSFLLLVALGLNKIGPIIAESLDSRERQIRDDFHAVMLQRAKALSKTYALVSNLCSLSSLVRNLASHTHDYSKFVIKFSHQSIPYQKRFFILYSTIMVFKEATLLQQRLTEKKIKRFYNRFFFLLLNKKKDKKKRKSYLLNISKIKNKAKALLPRLKKKAFAKIFSKRKEKIRIIIKNRKASKRFLLRKGLSILPLHTLNYLEYNWLASEYLLRFYPLVVAAHFRDLHKMDHLKRNFTIIYNVFRYTEIKELFLLK